MDLGGLPRMEVTMTSAWFDEAATPLVLAGLILVSHLWGWRRWSAHLLLVLDIRRIEALLDVARRDYRIPDDDKALLFLIERLRSIRKSSWMRRRRASNRILDVPVPRSAPYHQALRLCLRGVEDAERNFRKNASPWPLPGARRIDPPRPLRLPVRNVDVREADAPPVTPLTLLNHDIQQGA
jgi:hypothetical protein